MQRAHTVGSVPQRYRDAKLSDARQEVQDFAAAFLRGENPSGLLLTGSYGTGKTHDACSVLNRCQPETYRLLVFVNVPDLLDEIRDGYRHYSHSGEKLFDVITGKCRLAVLDDLGSESATDWAVERVQSIINARYSKCLPTIVTTNYGAAGLIEHYGKAMEGTSARRMVSRLSEMCQTVVYSGQDRRLA
ncbi:hypothetical protein Ccur_02920 [Cryptobacterium curtum DSM 15641]|uniref:IstB-like ATP-binding domain-containing protein n=1 Tax=Cryptobacterium curtum (strain ATCC 700683 / DSM 15641 / CCUG 43107 / 12-3) TaxID=469378 RepID=C7MM79_CRYCD|nr:ATP-binding protein [Cryptobacterium curtum]ACU94019.1 hypothetical protein Ccur_02920 [Cryptobacterium curtum DSM 15641]